VKVRIISAIVKDKRTEDNENCNSGRRVEAEDKIVDFNSPNIYAEEQNKHTRYRRKM
jgi:hypothetical protein